ncbi:MULTISPECIES: hypothetical protein [Microbacterium]|uniref:hypothetical protein n=1 Tax=Microbacterium TaxID=33882 RepID=UPI0025A1F522|nr:MULTISPECIES: hypothetical protein [Microbacterium]MDF2562737.1 hypothetical protein [Microbacterium sp.]MDQ1216713.1 hypothetical protein [Microbacterium arborescens]WJM16743.1 hypothetical protein QUC20_05375 [Microbacterium arborescens]
MAPPSAARRSATTAAVALVTAYARMRIRDLRVLLLNPLALVLSAVGVVGYLWILVSQGDDISGGDQTPGVRLAGLGLGLILPLVVLTAQRGSPLRLRPGDVSWVLASRDGPVLVLLTHALGTAAMGFIGASAASAIALVLRGEPPQLGLVSGVALTSILLLIRSVSLSAHALGHRVSKHGRAALVGVASAWAILWGVLNAAAYAGLVPDDGPFAWALAAVAQPIAAVVSPESADLTVSAGFIVLAAIAVSVLAAKPRVFVEPAVQESILANQLSKALSGGPSSALQSRGYAVGMRSWDRWPSRPIPAVLVSHLAQIRRRRWQYPATAVVLIAVVSLCMLSGGVVPVTVGVVIAVLLPCVSAASQLAAADLDHQHLLLADVSVVRTGLAGVLLNAFFDLVVAAPAVILGVSIQFGHVGWGIAYMVPLAAFFVCSSLAGVGARAFSEAPIGRAIAGLLLSAAPLLIAVSSVLGYGDDHVACRSWVTIAGTVIVAAVLYLGLAFAVFRSALPGARPGGTPASTVTERVDVR